MALSYESTRGGQKGVTASQAILKGLAEDGGLFMPTEIPKLDKTLEQLAGMTYQETAYEVMKLFLTDYSCKEEPCRQGDRDLNCYLRRYRKSSYGRFC